MANFKQAVQFSENKDCICVFLVSEQQRSNGGIESKYKNHSIAAAYGSQSCLAKIIKKTHTPYPAKCKARSS